MARMIKEMVVQDCPIRNVLARVCDKWSLLVIYTLKYHQDGPLRFNALRKLIPDISQKMLTSTLKSLEAGVPMETICKMLGHKDVKMTQRYARVTQKKLFEDMDKFIAATEKDFILAL